MQNFFSCEKKGFRFPTSKRWNSRKKVCVGDQSGGASPYPSAVPEYPDDVVDGSDSSFIEKHFGENQSMSGWDYMADVYPDGLIDGQDVAYAAADFGHGCYVAYNNTVSILAIDFNNGVVRSPDDDGFLSIQREPQALTSR
jgi:hypothetical protein